MDVCGVCVWGLCCGMSVEFVWRVRVVCMGNVCVGVVCV